MDLKNKNVAVIGAGVEGLSSVKYLVKKEARVALFDQKEESAIDKDTIAEIQKMGINYVFGPTYLDTLHEYELIFRSPGVRPDLDQLTGAKKRGIPVTSQTNYFFDRCPGSVVGVTGTKGKGTTSSLISGVLEKSGKKVFLGGNIGKPPLDFLDEVTSESVVVLELSSFQLMDLEKSPHVAVILSTTSEHRDWHKTDKEYFAAKQNIVKNQTEEDLAVISQDSETARNIGELSKAERYFFSTAASVEKGAYVDNGDIVLALKSLEVILNINDVPLPGRHNLQNILAATTVTGLLGISPNLISKTIASFKGLPHRLEFIKEVNGVKYYDDSASTNVETAVAAINSFENPKILILGGASKKSDFTPLGQETGKKNVKSVILIGDEANNIQNMDEIVEKVQRLS